jgi:hypothetical protein
MSVQGRIDRYVSAAANENTPPAAGYQRFVEKDHLGRSILKKAHNDLLERVEFSAVPGVGPKASILKRDISITSGVDHAFFSGCCGSSRVKDASGVD